MGEEVVLSEQDLEAAKAILAFAAHDCGPQMRSTIDEVEAMLASRAPGPFAYAELLPLREVLESVRDDRCPVDRDALEALLEKF